MSAGGCPLCDRSFTRLVDRERNMMEDHTDAELWALTRTLREGRYPEVDSWERAGDRSDRS